MKLRTNLSGLRVKNRYETGYPAKKVDLLTLFRNISHFNYINIDGVYLCPPIKEHVVTQMAVYFPSLC